MQRRYGKAIRLDPREKAPDGEITRNVVVAVIWLLLIYAAGIYLYQQYEGWGTIDTIYFITATVSTVGYGDVVPETNEGKILSIIIIWTGISLAFFVIYNIAMYRERIIDRQVTQHVLPHLRIFRDLMHSKGSKKQ